MEEGVRHYALSAYASFSQFTNSESTSAGEFTNCLKMKETTPLDNVTEYKYYAPGIGMVSDGTMKLVKAGKVAAANAGGER